MTIAQLIRRFEVNNVHHDMSTTPSGLRVVLHRDLDEAPFAEAVTVGNLAAVPVAGTPRAYDVSGFE